MLGPAFVIFMIFVILAVARTTDIYKLTIVFLMNFYTVTILNYGPASGLLIVALGFCEVFNRPSRSHRVPEINSLSAQPIMPAKLVSS
jgi:hypothetical protein